MPQLAALINNFTLSWDLGAIIFLFIAVFLYGFSVGQRRLGLLLLSVYFAYVLVGLMPYLEVISSRFGDVYRDWLESGVFLALVFVLFFILAGSVLRSTLGLPKKEDGQWWHLAVLAVATAGLLTASVLALLPVSYYNNFSTITKEVFIENFAHFAWAVVGILALVVLKRTKKK
jgi:hypothetical protein